MRIAAVLTVNLMISWIPAVALAQEMEPRNQELADKWMNTALPDHLRTRLAGEEVLFNGNLVTEEEAAKILAADNQKPTQKISALVDPKYYSSLQRQMKSSRLLEIIKTGKLVPSTYLVGEGENDVAKEQSLIGIYLELHTVQHSKPFAWGDVELHFDLAVLDRPDYIITPFWNYGNYGPLSASPEVNLGRVAYYVETYLIDKVQNEIVFLNEIPLSAVKTIVVKKGVRANLLKQISSRNLTCPHLGGCAALIIER